MSLTMFLEIERGAELQGIALALAGVGVHPDAQEQSVSGFFADSNCQFIFQYDSSPEEVLADLVEVDWIVGIRGSFHYRASDLHSSWKDIVKFIKSYADSQPFCFLLSFQFETIYAVRDRTGLRIVGPMPEID